MPVFLFGCHLQTLGVSYSYDQFAQHDFLLSPGSLVQLVNARGHQVMSPQPPGTLESSTKNWALFKLDLSNDQLISSWGSYTC